MVCLNLQGPNNRELLHRAFAASEACAEELYLVLVDSSWIKLGKTAAGTGADDTILANHPHAKVIQLAPSDAVGHLLRLAHQFRVGRIFVLREKRKSYGQLLGPTFYSDLLSRAKDVRVEIVGFDCRALVA